MCRILIYDLTNFDLSLSLEDFGARPAVASGLGIVIWPQFLMLSLIYLQRLACFVSSLDSAQHLLLTPMLLFQEGILSYYNQHSTKIGQCYYNAI